MRNIIGFLIIAIGAVLGVYVGFWLMFVGGISEVIEFFKTQNADSLSVALSIAKIIFASGVGAVIFWVSYLTGMMILCKSPNKFRKRN